MVRKCKQGMHKVKTTKDGMVTEKYRSTLDAPGLIKKSSQEIVNWSLGTCATEEEAARRYDWALMVRGLDPVNCKD